MCLVRSLACEFCECASGAYQPICYRGSFIYACVCLCCVVGLLSWKLVRLAFFLTGIVILGTWMTCLSPTCLLDSWGARLILFRVIYKLSLEMVTGGRNSAGVLGTECRQPASRGRDVGWEDIGGNGYG